MQKMVAELASSTANELMEKGCATVHYIAESLENKIEESLYLPLVIMQIQ